MGSYTQDEARDTSVGSESAIPQRPQVAPRQAREIPVVESKQNRFAWLKWLVGAIILTIAVGAAWMMWSQQRGIVATIDTNKYQAVFLSNGQVYFGKLTLVNSDYLQLASVYYLERQMTANSSASESETEQMPTDNNFQLLKYSDVLYGSEDAMIISKSDIIRYENLRPDGVVARAIADRE